MADPLTLPDTALVAEARSIIEAAAPPSLVAHSLRACLLGGAYGRARAMDFDEEGLLLAALFHDLGLCDGHVDGGRAFTFVSSDALRGFLAARGAPAARITPLCEAIELHMLLLPRFSAGAVVGLLQVGAWMDVTGLRRRAVPDAARAIAAAHPRGDLAPVFRRRLLRSLGSASACLGLIAPGLARRPAP